MGVKAQAASDVGAITARLAQLRVAKKMNARTLCALAGISETRWSNWENGKGRPDLDGAVLLCEAFGVTLDWIYFGDPTALPSNVRDELAAVPLPRRNSPFVALSA